MAFNAAVNEILVQSYAKIPGPLGVGFNFKGGRYVWMLSKDTITVGMAVAYKAATNPGLCQIMRHDHTNTTTAGLALGIACASSVTGQYTCVWIGGVCPGFTLADASVVPTLITDGSIAAGLPGIPSATTDGTVIAGTAAGDANRLFIAIADDSSNDLVPTSLVMINRFGL